MPIIKFNDPHDFLEVTITGKTTEQLRQEARDRQEYARTVINDHSDMVPQFGSVRKDYPGMNITKGPEAYRHTPQDTDMISHGGTLDGQDAIHKVLPKRRPKTGKGSSYSYGDYSQHAESQISGVNTGSMY